MRGEIMEPESIAYKGCDIFPKPGCGRDGRWYGSDEMKARDGATVSTRSYIFPAFLFFDAAWTDSVDHARIKSENLILAGMLCA